ncbi:hypothetical protein JTB14_037896, partial [Gonioctena quinquepunctata]
LLTELELGEIARNLDLDQSDLDNLSWDDDEDEVDLGLENVVPDPDDIEIADNMSDSSDEEPLAHYLPGKQKNGHVLVSLNQVNSIFKKKT